MNKLKKALIVVTNHGELGDTGRRTGWYLPEVSHVYYPLSEAGYQVDFASPQGGRAPMDQGSLDLDDPLNRRFVEEDDLLPRFDATLPLAQVKAEEYAIVYYSGGHGTLWDFPNHPEVNRVTLAIYEQGGVVSAVCHGVAALVDVKLSDDSYLVAGHEINSFTDAEERAVELENIVPFLLESRLRERGARFRSGEVWANTVVVSDRIVTGQNPQSAHSLGNKIVEVASIFNNHNEGENNEWNRNNPHGQWGFNNRTVLQGLKPSRTNI